MLILILLFNFYIDNKKCYGPTTTPLKVNDQDMLCNVSAKSDQCPRHSVCTSTNYSSNMLSVCCPKCLRGPPVTDVDGMQFNCSLNSTNVQCPYGTYCVVSGRSSIGVCCKNFSEKSKCGSGFGYPLGSGDGQEMFCGRGSRHQDCPKGYVCRQNPLDRLSVCCLNITSQQKCRHGVPYRYNGTEIVCNVGNNKCPPSYRCVRSVGPKKSAVCCQILTNHEMPYFIN